MIDIINRERVFQALFQFWPQGESQQGSSGTEAFSHWHFPLPELMGSWLRAVPIYDGIHE